MKRNIRGEIAVATLAARAHAAHDQNDYKKDIFEFLEDITCCPSPVEMDLLTYLTLSELEAINKITNP